MDENRKRIVIEEVTYWKDNHLLPKEYCDFLLALYYQGEEDTEDFIQESTRTINKEKVLFGIHAALLLMMIPVSFLVIYFTEISILLQTGLVTFLLLLLVGDYFFSSRQNSILTHVVLLVFFLLLFLGMMTVLNEMGASIAIIHSAIALNCLLWILFGYFSKYTYVLGLGIATLLAWLVYYFL
ncbi:hypothetical protein N781_11260 [Pontibacillus halophilus JSM 076056 = DSM 19796]|uniref:Uncharacterized protein n=1 Tax=Pontibacillus halophilus JSM 076056 = DSM 19796 TaxID=1385510 RepID=A0A0A5GK35_9BACI|nr:hypothetical protein [Pontibacillus halophilus]KGX93641.1 hypothetical protein N781_11260 [Pontibacillus halophilus JSM 076056 = DSM 19796]